MKTKILAAVLAFAANSAFAGAITNGDFASGTLSGWSANGSATVGASGTYNFADLYAGLGANVYTTLSQVIYLQAGDVLTGTAQFFAHDYMPFNDNAYVSIGGTNLFTSSISAVGDYGTSALSTFSYTALTAGNYILSAGVDNYQDNGQASELQISNFSVTSNVPEPASIALMGLGLLGVAALRRKTKI